MESFTLLPSSGRHLTNSPNQPTEDLPCVYSIINEINQLRDRKVYTEAACRERKKKKKRITNKRNRRTEEKRKS